MGRLPPMLFGVELIENFKCLPNFDERIRDKSQTERLLALNNLYSLYFPNSQAIELYTKLYLSLSRAEQRMTSKDATMQLYENAKRIKKTAFINILESNSSSSFSFIGPSGCGKSTTLFHLKRLFESEKENSITILLVELPFDSSVKSLLLEILRQIDIKVGSKYFELASKSRIATVDVLIGNVANCIINHSILCIAFDECQNMIRSNNGLTLLNCLTQLINSSSCTLLFCGTPEVSEFFSKTMFIARRTTGIIFDNLNFIEFKSIFSQLFSYQYCKTRIQINSVLLDWFWLHTQGNISSLMSLFHDAQEYAILDGSEVISIDSLNKAFRQRFQHLKTFVHTDVKKSLGNAKNNYIEQTLNQQTNGLSSNSIKEFVCKAKREKINVSVELSKIIITSSFETGKK